VNINEWVAPESNNTQFEFKKRAVVTTIPDVAASFLLITYAHPTVVILGGRAPGWGRAKGFAAPLSTALSLHGKVVIRCFGLPHHMHLLVPIWHLGVVWFVPSHFPRGSTEHVGWLLGRAGQGFFGFTLSLEVPGSNPFLFWLIRFSALHSVFTRSTSTARSYSSW